MRNILNNGSEDFPSEPSQESNVTVLKNAVDSGAEEIDPTPYFNMQMIRSSSPEQFISHTMLPWGDKSPLETGPEVGSAQENYVNALKQESEQRASVVNNMPDSFFSKGLNIAGNIYGGVVSPVGILSGEAGSLALKGVGYIAPKILPELSSRIAPYAIPKSILGKVGTLTAERPILSNLSLNVAKSSMKGAIAGSTSFAALTPFQYMQEQAHQDNTSMWGDLKENLKQGFWLGAGTGAASPLISEVLKRAHAGVIGSIDKTQIGTPQSSADAVSLAQDQMVAGKKINVKPIIDNTLYTDANKITPEQVESAQSQNELMQSHMDNLDKDIQDISPVSHSEDMTTLGIVKKLSVITRKSALDRTSQEENFRDQMLDIPYHRKLLDAHIESPMDRTTEQKDLINNASDMSVEKDNLQSLVDLYKNDKSDFMDNVDPNNTDDIEQRNIKDTFDVMDKRAEFMQDRIDDIDTMMKDPETMDRANKINRLELLKDNLQSMSDKNQGLINLKDNSKPVTQSDVNDQMADNVDPRNDTDHDSSAHENYNDNYKDTKFKDPENLDDVSKEFSDMEEDKEKGEIDDEAKENEDSINSIGDMITKAVKCMMGVSNV